jgi:hypothetical protein
MVCAKCRDGSRGRSRIERIGAEDSGETNAATKSTFATYALLDGRSVDLGVRD